MFEENLIVGHIDKENEVAQMPLENYLHHSS